jgi:hypothetical protein
VESDYGIGQRQWARGEPFEGDDRLRASQLLTAGVGPAQTGDDSLANAFALELRKRTRDEHLQLASRRARALARGHEAAVLQFRRSPRLLVGGSRATGRRRMRCRGRLARERLECIA